MTDRTIDVRPPGPARRAARCRRRRAAGGFTLVEMATSLAVTALVLAGIGSALVVVVKALPDPNTASTASRDAESAAALIASELRYARAVAGRSDTSVTFTVADRDGDGTDETVSYAWGDATGGPLRRTYNGAEADLVPNVRSFRLTFATRAEQKVQKITVESTGSEVVVAAFQSYPSGTPTNKNLAVTTNTFVSEYFLVDQTKLPANTNKATLTRARVWVRGLAGGGDTTVGIYKAVGGGNPQPTATAIGTPTTVAAAGLPTAYGWHDVPLSGVELGNLGQELCVVLKGKAATAGCDVQYLYNAKAAKDTPTMTWTTDAGATWQPPSSQHALQDMKFIVYAVPTTSTQQEQTVTRYYLTDASVRLTAGGAGRLAVADAATQVLNEPEVATP